MICTLQELGDSAEQAQEKVLERWWLGLLNNCCSLCQCKCYIHLHIFDEHVAIVKLWRFFSFFKKKNPTNVLLGQPDSNFNVVSFLGRWRFGFYQGVSVCVHLLLSARSMCCCLLVWTKCCATYKWTLTLTLTLTLNQSILQSCEPMCVQCGSAGNSVGDPSTAATPAS